MNTDRTKIFFFLISNNDFRDWISEPNDERSLFWKKWMEKHPENIEEVLKAREFIERLRFKSKKLSPDQLDILLGKIIKNEDQRISTSPIPKSKGVNLKNLQWVKFAAILSIVMLATLFTEMIKTEKIPLAITEWRTIENPRGKKSKVILPDGTAVNLNYESQLKFPVAFEGSSRKVELIGEAFFEVVHNDTLPFIVKTNNIEIQVLGTSFNINSFEKEDITNVSLVSGKVKIKKSMDTSEEGLIYLLPGQELIYNKNTHETRVEKFDVQRTIAWKDGIILFKDAGFEEMITQLERWYGVDFQIHGKPSKIWNINGRYQNEKLENILVSLNFVYDLEYDTQGKNITLKLK